jgi:DNA polymerase
LGQNQTTKKWEKIPTYGGKLTENLVQAIARDCLAEALLNLTNAGYRALFHIHDEIIAEVIDMGPNSNQIMLDDMIKILCKVPEWADGLPLNADRIYK